LAPKNCDNDDEMSRAHFVTGYTWPSENAMSMPPGSSWPA
jgi:hypothetical protein